MESITITSWSEFHKSSRRNWTTIVNQFALFTLMSSSSTWLDCRLEGYQRAGGHLVIPKSPQWEVRDRLDQANNIERVLFPGIVGMSARLTRYYQLGPFGAAPDGGSAPAWMTAPG